MSTQSSERPAKLTTSHMGGAIENYYISFKDGAGTVWLYLVNEETRPETKQSDYYEIDICDLSH